MPINMFPPSFVRNEQISAFTSYFMIYCLICFFRSLFSVPDRSRQSLQWRLMLCVMAFLRQSLALFHASSEKGFVFTFHVCPPFSAASDASTAEPASPAPARMHGHADVRPHASVLCWWASPALRVWASVSTSSSLWVLSTSVSRSGEAVRAGRRVDGGCPGARSTVRSATGCSARASFGSGARDWAACAEHAGSSSASGSRWADAGCAGDGWSTCAEGSASPGESPRICHHFPSPARSKAVNRRAEPARML
jgi:hypothetical protein